MQHSIITDLQVKHRLLALMCLEKALSRVLQIQWTYYSVFKSIYLNVSVFFFHLFSLHHRMETNKRAVVWLSTA